LTEKACHFTKAAECAGAEGRFWEMNDALFSIQDKINSSDVDVELLAVQIGLNRSAFEECMASDEPMAANKGDLDTTMEKKLRGTPIFLMHVRVFRGRLEDQVTEHSFGFLDARTAGGQCLPSRWSHLELNDRFSERREPETFFPATAE
jgi:predicted DsbA family dithiol-disulfide isomerase